MWLFVVAIIHPLPSMGGISADGINARCCRVAREAAGRSCRDQEHGPGLEGGGDQRAPA